MTLLDAAREMVEKELKYKMNCGDDFCKVCGGKLRSGVGAWVGGHRTNCAFIKLRRAVEQEGQNAKQ